MPHAGRVVALQAREPVALGLGRYLATGERLEVADGSASSRLLTYLAPDAQLRRFGKIIFDVVTEPMDVDEDSGDPYARVHVGVSAHEDAPQRDEDEHRERPHLRLVREKDSPVTDHEDNVLAAVANALRKLLAAVDQGDLTATDSERHRLEGAVAALDGLARPA